jgi:hypothetical protein
MVSPLEAPPDDLSAVTVKMIQRATINHFG